MEIDCEMSLSSADSRRAVVSYKQKYMHCILVNGKPHSLSLPRGKNVVRLTDRLDITTTVAYDIKPQTRT